MLDISVGPQGRGIVIRGKPSRGTGMLTVRPVVGNCIEVFIHD